MNVDHLRRFRAGVEEWNAWRDANPGVQPNLSAVDLNGSITKSTLFKRRSAFAAFQSRSARSYDLRGADLRFSRIWLMELEHADLGDADLEGAELRFCNLQHASLRGANLRRSQWIGCDLRHADMRGARFGDTHLGFTTLGTNDTIASIHHAARSHADQFTLLAAAPLPESLALAFGVPAHVARLVHSFATQRPYRRCFLSYSRHDELFTMYFREALTWYGVPSWFAPADMRDPRLHRDARELERDLYTYVDEADVAVLIGSPNILSSAWVGKEFQRASTKPMIVALIDTFPPPDSEEWRSAIARTVAEGVYTQLDPEAYSTGLQAALSKTVIDFRDWRDPSRFAQSLGTVLQLLRDPATVKG